MEELACCGLEPLPTISAGEQRCLVLKESDGTTVKWKLGSFQVLPQPVNNADGATAIETLVVRVEGLEGNPRLSTLHARRGSDLKNRFGRVCFQNWAHRFSMCACRFSE